ncbi:DUF1501 domain-containing protein [Singulisphaera sp. PoT]|uniref:DUF1501 domain-containing protein n=1 Tax=Singulisphaera sp. PoT TaxID=3411797 RepID=UPI003BF54E2F
MSRRDFLKVAGMSPLGLSAHSKLGFGRQKPGQDRSVIFLMLVGGPSQLDTFDPKPDAPSEVRGPFRSIDTSVPGVRVCEHLPELAKRMDRVSLIRSLYHEAAPIHETGSQLIQTGRLCGLGRDYPHFGSVAASMLEAKNGLPPFVLLPKPIGHTGVNVSHGQTAGILGKAWEPYSPASSLEAVASHDAAMPEALHSTPSISNEVNRCVELAAEADSTRARYGRNPFGESCLRARRLVEAGVRVVTVNMYETVFRGATWDCHGTGPFSTLADYATEVLPTFDRAYSALLDDLDSRGLLDSTLVVATGEFGRSPRLNAAGGRDHWPGVWSALLAGGGTRAGEVIGASDSNGSSPADRPVRPAELVATVYRSLGIDPSLTYSLESGEVVSLLDQANHLREALA